VGGDVKDVGWRKPSGAAEARSCRRRLTAYCGAVVGHGSRFAAASRRRAIRPHLVADEGGGSAAAGCLRAARAAAAALRVSMGPAAFGLCCVGWCWLLLVLMPVIDTRVLWAAVP
jgi:hypothetical protein